MTTPDPLRQQPPGQRTAAERLGFTEAPPQEPPKPARIPAGPMGTKLPEPDLIRAALRRIHC
jgi:hypothetical protein